MVGGLRSQQSSRNTMRPPPKPTNLANGRAQSPADALSASAGSRARSPSVPPSAGIKRKEREFDQDQGEETNIHVVVRCRGRSEREVRENSGVVVSTSGVKSKTVELSMGPNAISNKTYHFDKVFSPAADQAIIFEDVVSPVLNEMITGYNCTIFAYGQTGTGKTYTMSGDMTDTLGLLSDAAGIIPRVLYSLFQKLESDQLECSVKCSFIELYNEELRDLLSPDENVKLKIYDDASRKSHAATLVQGMEESHIKTATEGIKLLQQGSYRRQVAATKCNDLSSRSHTVFTITTYIKKPSETGEDFICSGKLNLVDLAGSENIQRSGAENKRAAEAGLINKSLLTLGRVINALVDKSSHIPYRESKLTRLLQDSLGGRTKTCIIATVSPAKSNLEETISTLDYAFRAKNIRNKPQVNSMISKKTLLREFTTEIEKLKSELIATRQRNGVYLTNEQYEEITVESESRRILSEEQKARIETIEASLRNKGQELFSLTNNFQNLRRHNEDVKSALKSAEDVLEKTKIVLRDTQQSLTEETEIRKAHENTENALQDIGRDLISTMTDSVSDLDGLHAKIQRHSSLHDQNKQRWQISLETAIQTSDLIESKMQSFENEHAQLASHMTQNVHQFIVNQLANLNRAQDSLLAKLVALKESKEKLGKEASTAHSGMSNVLEEIKILRDEVKANIGEGLQVLSTAAAKISAEVISELDEFHTQLHASYAGLGRDFKSMFEDATRQLLSQREEIACLRGALQDANDRNIAATQTASEKLQTCLVEEQKTALEDRNQLLEKITALIHQSATQQDQRIASRIEEVRSSLANSTSDFRKADKEYNERMDEWMLRDTDLLEKITESKDDLKNKMKNDWTAISSRNSAIQTSTKTIHAETIKIVDAQLEDMATQMAALDGFVTRARTQNDAHCAEQATRWQELFDDLHHSFDEMAHDLQERKASTDTFSTDFRDSASGLDGLMLPYASEFSRSLADLRSQIRSSSMTEYVPTGETPLKKEWIYHKTLPQTDNHESIIARLRGIPDPTTAGARTPAKSRTPGRPSPKKLTSPRKLNSPSKLQVYSPTKAKIYADNGELNHTVPLSKVPPVQQDSSKTGLKEIDVNVVTQQQRPVDDNHGHPDPPAAFSKSVGSGQPPPLKRHATAGAVSESVTRVPTKLGGGGRGKLAAEGRENHTMPLMGLSQSLGPGNGRRLRSSPPQ